MPAPTAGSSAAKRAFDLQQAIQLHQQGDLAGAEKRYKRLLAEDSRNFNATHLLGVLHLQRGRYTDAVKQIGAAVKLGPGDPAAWSNLGLAQHNLGKNGEALASFDKSLALKPDFADALTNRGNTLLALNQLEDALASYQKAADANPSSAEAKANIGNVLLLLKRPQEALAACDRALALKPNFLEALLNRANALLALKQYQLALLVYEDVLRQKPDSVEAWNNRGSALRELRRFGDALASHDRALALKPDSFEALGLGAAALSGLGRHEEALARCDRALAIRPNFADALNNRGNALSELRRHGEALDAYDRAITARPDFPEAHANRANALRMLNRSSEALVGFDIAIAARPDYAEAHYYRGLALQALKRPAEAVEAFERAMALAPAHPEFFNGYALAALHACDWAKTGPITRQLPQLIAGGRALIHPFTLVGYDCPPAARLQCATAFYRNQHPVRPPPLWNGEPYAHDKIRVAYLSADFNAHATAFLMAEMFELHDRSRFEIIALSYGPDDGSDIRRRLEAAFDQFENVGHMSDAAIARRIRELEVDIAVDLKGYTRDSRPAILSHRPAPVQASYLGFPGTMGVDFIDYMLADPVIIPAEQQGAFSERIVHLPDSYQANDRQRKVADYTPTRTEAGLPEQGFVFCAFNNSWKITPAVFDIWMRLLRDTPGSVLWLLGDNEDAQRNLAAAAEARGVELSRMVFAERVSPEDHLARHRLADLFLDTLPCCAHTTASDALWAGLPLLTTMGDNFIGRVAASLLKAVGLPELAAANLSDYEALARKLAADPALLAGYRARLAANRLTAPLFDTPLLVRNIEAAYNEMIQRKRSAQPPAPFAV